MVFINKCTLTPIFIKHGTDFKSYKFDGDKIISSAVVGGLLGLTGGAGMEIAAAYKLSKRKQYLTGALGATIGNELISVSEDIEKGEFKTAIGYAIESSATFLGFLFGGVVDEVSTPLVIRITKYANESSLANVPTIISTTTVKGAKQLATNGTNQKTSDKVKEIGTTPPPP